RLPCQAPTGRPTIARGETPGMRAKNAIEPQRGEGTGPTQGNRRVSAAPLRLKRLCYLGSRGETPGVRPKNAIQPQRGEGTGATQGNRRVSSAPLGLKRP